MGSDGSFSFSYNFTMSSDLFKPKNSSITVYSTATSSTSDKEYDILLYKFSDDKKVGSTAVYTANGTTQKFTWTGLDTNTTYYLYFSKPLSNGGKITGSGRIDYSQ